MSHMHSKPNRWAAARQELHARRAARAARDALAKDLAAFDSPNDRLELSAILARHEDVETAEIRQVLDRMHAA